MKTILIVDDDAAIRELLATTFLREKDFEVALASTGVEGFELALEKAFDLLLLDVMMPGLSGIEVTQKLRENGVVTPILILTAREDEEARLRGLGLGADDYLEKTTPMKEIVLRARGLIRRHTDYDKAGGALLRGKFQLSDLLVDLDAKSVTFEGKLVSLTKREFDILAYLIKHQGETVSRDKLLLKFWGLSSDVAETRTIDVSLSQLRKKLKKRYIRTKRGYGVIFDASYLGEKEGA
ncbi:MAG: response regulator transcription factor [Streptococcaceae bacterium]|jgi:DNA-binding response OmpR family regulator|nr:response regulator transcription factor [Streptococcaceae bacterium]